MPHRLRRALPAFVALALGACATVPKTSEEAFQQTRVRPQGGGNMLVIGPVLPFRVRRTFAYTAFQALIEPHHTTYSQRTLFIGNRRGRESQYAYFTREDLERFRTVGFPLTILNTDVKVRFEPYYLDGFLRKVDSVARPEAPTQPR